MEDTGKEMLVCFISETCSLASFCSSFYHKCDGVYLKELSQPFVPYKHRPLNKQLKLLNSVRLTFSSDFSVSRKQKLCLNNLMQSGNSEPYTDAAWSQKHSLSPNTSLVEAQKLFFFFHFTQ